MERRDIEIFLTLAEELHFGRTAERLHVSTARVSQSVRKLERRIGLPLFERTSRRVALTPIGRRLRDEVGPAYQEILDAFERAVAAGREVRGTLRVTFFSAAGGQFVHEVADQFRACYPDCEVHVRENQFSDGIGSLLHAGEIDVLLAVLPFDDPGITAGKVLLREGCLLGVPARHPLARRASVSVDDVVGDRVLRAGDAVPDYWDEVLAPLRAPGSRPVERGPAFATLQELLSLIGAGKGVFPFPAQAAHYYVRPDVAFVPMHDAPPFEWTFFWRTTPETHRVRAFVQTAEDVVKANDDTWLF